jgi:cytidylate kinase
LTRRVVATTFPPLRRLIIAIDGPAGAGKSTVSKGLAARLGYQLLDTGAIYRSVALLARRQGVSWDDGPGCADLARGLAIRFQMVDGKNRAFLGDEDVSAAIRTPEISQGASKVSALPEVRAGLLELQRRLAAGGGVVAEGRDVGTVVFPNADAKFFLTASPEERARRRTEELAALGQPTDYDRTLAEIRERDERDSTRSAAPLRQAEDAILVDSSDQTPEAIIEKMARIVESKAS